MEEFDIDVLGTIKGWPRWKRYTVSIALLLLIGYAIWFSIFINPPCGVCGN